MSLKDLYYFQKDLCPICHKPQIDYGLLIEDIDSPAGKNERTRVIKCTNCKSIYSLFSTVTEVYINEKGTSNITDEKPDKTCETCKYFNQRGDSRGICFKKGSNIYKQSFHMQFGCNLHEYKECK